MNTKKHEIGRREFLVSSTCALAAVAVAPKMFGSTAVSSPPKRLAVGFVTFDERASLIAASGIPASDGTFIGRGARITASGASGASGNPADRRAVELLTHYSYFDGAEQRETPFRAWACSRATGCQGNNVTFAIPVDERQHIRFGVVIETGSTEPGTPTSRRSPLATSAVWSQELPVTLSLQEEPDSLRLARGFYSIVPLFEDDAEPRWSDWQVQRIDGRFALTDSDGKAATFEHFVLRIDYAS